ncbi:unnamed protein product [Caenorhabditis auriculariae]|uniref:Uncharacterized protein n=1 Tax=Caenorhabditis auriculariae TaxID=2777116 RepID=A0A8S1HHM7_9PELO|nr:unnamed protein product [Caenorhabditis auriculariae]
MANVAIDSGDLLLESMTTSIKTLEDQIKSTKTAQLALNQNAELLAEFMRELNEHEAPLTLYSHALKTTGFANPNE